MARLITIYDTTLRDGTQGEGVSFSMEDKVRLASRFDALWQVVAGTTMGMLLANVPVVAFGSRFAQRLPLRAARMVAALVFLALGLWAAAFGIG